MSLVISVVLVTVYLVIYSNNLWKKKNKSTKIISEVDIPRYFVIIVAVITLSFIVIGILMQFVPPNNWIGVRISKTLANPELFRRINRISGLGTILIGLVFSILFFIDASLDSEKR
jgi:ABC-type enterochelin transport system permease subunit